MIMMVNDRMIDAAKIPFRFYRIRSMSEDYSECTEKRFNRRTNIAEQCNGRRNGSFLLLFHIVPYGISEM